MMLCLTSLVFSAPIISAATVYLRGTFNGWEARSEYAMAYENGRYLITTHLNKGDYEYKAATDDWSTFQAPVQGNESLSLDSDCDVTFIAYTDSNIIEAFPHSSLEADVKKVVLRSKWMEHSDLVLVQKNSAISYQSVGTSYPAAAYWNILSDNDGAFYLQNNATGDYAALNGSAVVCVSSADDGNTSWYVDTTMDGARFINTSNEKAIINIEKLSGSAQASSVPMYYTSSQWGFEYSSYDYQLKTDKVIDTGYNAYANSPTSITSYMTGSKKTWNRSKNLSAYPKFTAKNPPLAEAVYNLSLEGRRYGRVIRRCRTSIRSRGYSPRSATTASVRRSRPPAAYPFLNRIPAPAALTRFPRIRSSRCSPSGRPTLRTATRII